MASNIRNSEISHNFKWKVKAESSAFAAMVRKELIMMSRYPVQFFTSFAQVFLIVAVFSLAGSMFFPDGADSGRTDIFSGVVIYGFVLFIFLNDTLWTIGYNIRREQVQGTLEQLYLSPASKFANLVSRVTNMLVWTSLISLVGVFGMVLILGVENLPFKHPGLAVYILVMTLSGTFGVGFIFAAITLRIKETAQTLVNLIQFAFLILCANFFPFSALPGPLLSISKIIPLAYGVDAFRSTVMGYPSGFPELASIDVEILIVTLTGVFMPIIGYRLYKRAENHARRVGSLAEF